MTLTPERRDQLLAATREAAAAFLEDMPHIRETVNKIDPDRAELRRLSNVLRRLLIDKGGDLRDVTAPRIGKFALVAPDNKLFYDIAKKRPYAFWASGGVDVFGVSLRTVFMEAATNPPESYDNFDADRCISLPMDNFLSQRVLCLQGEWVTRRDAIKYIANIASGVHSSAAKNDADKLIARIRRSASYRVLGNDLHVTVKIDALHASDTAVSYEPSSIDPVLVEVLATAHFLAQSPDLRELELVVQRELGVSS